MLDRRRGARGVGAVALDEVLALEGHAVLDRDAAAQRLHALDVARGDGLAMVEHPVQSIEGNLAVDLLEHVEHARDRFVIGRVQAEGPAVGDQVAHHLLELVLHAGRQVGARLQEVLEVGGREHQHLAGAVVAVPVAALPRRHHPGPALEVFQFLALVLGEQVVGDADRQLAGALEFLDDRVVLGVVLEAAAGVDCAGQAQAVQLAHELAGRIHLQLARQGRALGQGRVQDHRVRARDQHAGRVAGGVTLDLAARRVRGVLGVAHRAQGGAVEQRAVVQVQDEDRRVGRGGVDLVQGRHAALGELELAPAAHHAHPLRMRRARRLVLQHAQRVGKRGHAFPAQLEVVIQAAADQVQVGVVQARDDGAAVEVDDLAAFGTVAHDIVGIADGQEAAVADGDRAGLGLGAVHGVEAAVEQNQGRRLRLGVSGLHGLHLSVSPGAGGPAG